MVLRRHIWQLIGFCVTTALAVAVLQMIRVHTGAIITMWIPAGIAMAGFYIQPFRNWPLLSVMMLAVLWPAFHLTQIPILLALGFTIGLILQSMICAAISVRVLSGRDRLPQSSMHIAGLLFAAIFGCVCAGLIVQLFRFDLAIYYFAWWAISNTLAILAVTNVTIALWRRVTGRSVQRAGQTHGPFIAALCMCALASVFVLQYHTLALIPLLALIIVLMGTQFGQLGTSSAVLTVGFCAFGLSIFAGSPVPGIDWAPNHAGLLVQGWMLMMLAIASPVSAILLKREQLERELRSHNDRLHENVTILGLAEQLAGVGRYRIDLKARAQAWSPSMLELHGLPPELAPDPGDLSQILPDKGVRLFEILEINAQERLPYSFEHFVKPPLGPERILRISILNEFDRQGERVAIFGVAIDVTEQIRRLEALDLARSRAVRLAAEAQKIANTDVLTGLPNRRCTFGRLEAMVQTASRCATPLGAIMFDIDHFKRVNDTFGHKTGDDVLVKVAELARSKARGTDLVGRIGGEEFIWLLPGLSTREARRLAERLRETIENGTHGEGRPPVTASIGVAMHRRGDTVESLLARADAALYGAKQAGRNQVKRVA